MFLVGILCALLVSASAQSCYNDTEKDCGNQSVTFVSDDPDNCNSKYGGINKMLIDLQSYANFHIYASFKFLLMSSHFGTYEMNREGFKSLYRKLSDDAWEKSIDTIKYITSRGGSMNFNQMPHIAKVESGVLEVTELASLAKALDWTKLLAEEALKIHRTAMKDEDSAVAHFMEEKFMESQTKTIRTLSGYVSDVKGMLKESPPLGLFLFDEYLQKTL